MIAIDKYKYRIEFYTETSENVEIYYSNDIDELINYAIKKGYPDYLIDYNELYDFISLKQDRLFWSKCAIYNQSIKSKYKPTRIPF